MKLQSCNRNCKTIETFMCRKPTNQECACSLVVPTTHSCHNPCFHHKPHHTPPLI